MASGALRLVDLSTRFERAIGVADFDNADFLDACGGGLLGINRTGSGLVGRCHIENQANDDENWNDERGQTQQKHLLWGFDRACVGFVLIVAVVAHENLCWGVAAWANV
jgi:hypothetical protein